MHILTKSDLVEHDVFELMKGTFSGTHWLEDSLFIPEDLFQQMNLEKLFCLGISSFSYFGITVVTKSEWENVKRIATDTFPLTIEIVKEIDDWAKVCFETEECFTICGI